MFPGATRRRNSPESPSYTASEPEKFDPVTSSGRLSCVTATEPTPNSGR